MNLNNHLLAGFNVMANTTVTISGYSSIDCIFDNSGQAYKKDMLFVSDFETPIIVKTTDLPVSHKAVIGKIATLDGSQYRIERIKVGSATTFLFLNSKDNP